MQQNKATFLLQQFSKATVSNEFAGIVIPTHNAWDELEGTLTSLQLHVPSVLPIVIDDNSKDGTAIYAKEHGCIVPFHMKKIGYGNSLVEGLQKAFYEFECPQIVEMDADHPVDKIPDIIAGLQSGRYDMIIGVESGKRSVRSVAGFLAKHLLALGDFRHPTCGLVGFTQDALSLIFAKEKIKSNNDFVHVELLYKAKRCGLRFGEVEFDGSKHPKHRTSIVRVIKWLWSFSFLFAHRMLWHIWVDTLRKIFGFTKGIGGM